MDLQYHLQKTSFKNQLIGCRKHRSRARTVGHKNKPKEHTILAMQVEGLTKEEAKEQLRTTKEELDRSLLEKKEHGGSEPIDINPVDRPRTASDSLLVGT
jgi:hypothetical protein